MFEFCASWEATARRSRIDSGVVSVNFLTILAWMKFHGVSVLEFSTILKN